ncbi:uncharacterized protein BP5553_01053 [Venustampulla echinocandica]|uniref:Choline kinase N-terminal domain-containing protein n=1 Tax=Venustampulla echinocandica TaxID=2656787 RepID=A0A370TZX1_9HELO|nr:uncharacterized protein BP5553_01053 [Venustampulla echinocandica]RDL41074.1 hypothetical protein BP5553_01053 [Venustampulla echinocandica]
MTPPTSLDKESAGSALPLRPALKPGDDPGSPKSDPKVVSIMEEPEPIPPLSTPSEESLKIKQFNAGVGGKRLSGRPQLSGGYSSSRHSIISQSNVDETDTSSSSRQNGPVAADGAAVHRHRHHQHDRLLSQVAQWLQIEKTKRAARKAKKTGGEAMAAVMDQQASRPRAASQSSDSSAISLDKLQQILEDSMSLFGQEDGPGVPPSTGSRRSSYVLRSRRSSKSSARRLTGFASSDTEYQDGDVVVPSCDEVLDNSKTMSYSGGGASVDSSDTTTTLSTSKKAEKERKYWGQFKHEIVRLAHTLRLKGWRKVPLDRGPEIEVERLSGALTNAVYVVSPPKVLPVAQTSSTSNPKPHSPKPPPKLLLRIYGPQVEHLIDRQNELQILRRLARKKIGPRLLGTFTNGRFEEYFNAKTLEASDLRIEDTSKQIAKRMRELHDGIELLEREREEGPAIWKNWDKWVDRCEVVTTYLDREILDEKRGKGESWRERGLVCGVEWKAFKDALDKYRKWLDEYYKAKGDVRYHLVFSHNDTQYGNILRLIPPSPSEPTSDGTLPPPSPLLLPQNHHKQLTIIDFEYASANTPGLEFANHFTEWCYNYHDPDRPWACNTDRYPTLEQQRRFIRSYVNHRPQFNPRASETPKLLPIDKTTAAMRGGVNEFLLDSRSPPGGSSSNLGLKGDEVRPPGGFSSSSSLNLKLEESMFYAEEEKRREADIELKVARLLEETHIWRVANSAMWVAWGIVQAKVPGLDGDADANSEPSSREQSPLPTKGTSSGKNEEGDGKAADLAAEDPLNGKHVEEPEKCEDSEGDGEEDHFDYLAYAQDRALFFWGDIVALGIVKAEDLPEELARRLKTVEY